MNEIHLSIYCCRVKYGMQRLGVSITQSVIVVSILMGLSEFHHKFDISKCEQKVC